MSATRLCLTLSALWEGKPAHYRNPTVNQSWPRLNPTERSVTGFQLPDRGAPSFQSKRLSREGLSFLWPQWPSHRCKATGLNQSPAFYLSHTLSTKAAEATVCAVTKQPHSSSRPFSARLLIRHSYRGVRIQCGSLYNAQFCHQTEIDLCMWVFLSWV